MQRMALIAALVALAGCFDVAEGAEPGQPSQEAPTSCPWQPRPQAAEVLVSGYHIRSPEGYREAGRYHEFEWSDDLAHLTRIELTLDWQADGPLTEQLMVGLPSAIHGPDYYAYGPYEGASPITVAIQSPSQVLLSDPLQVNLGVSANQTPVGGWTGPAQAATLRLHETYDPCLRRD